MMHDVENFEGLPPFPGNVPTVPLLRLSLRKLQNHDDDETRRLWRACCGLGFFYLDLKDSTNANGTEPAEKSPSNLAVNGQADGLAKLDTHIANGGNHKQSNGAHAEGINGDAFLRDADSLFKVAEEFSRLPVEEKVKYDFKDQGSYFGYKGYGAGVIDKLGTLDRNEFYNTSKDDIIGISEPLPAPALMGQHRALLASFIRTSSAIVSLILSILNEYLRLPPNTLQNLHRLSASSGDQVRFVISPPQPESDRRTALGEHTDFGSVTLLFNRLGGLQVLPPGPDAQWAYVRPLPGHCIVNLGDAMVKFTAGVLRSNIHRVVNPPGEQAAMTRYSLVYFARPEDEVLLKRLEGSEMIDEAAKGMGDGEVVSSKEWVLRRALGRRGVGSFDKSEGTEAISKMARSTVQAA